MRISGGATGLAEDSLDVLAGKTLWESFSFCQRRRTVLICKLQIQLKKTMEGQPSKVERGGAASTTSTYVTPTTPLAAAVYRKYNIFLLNSIAAYPEEILIMRIWCVCAMYTNTI